MERTAVLSYTAKDGPGGPAPEEASHARLLEEILKSPGGGMQGRDVALAEGRHKSGGNALRAAVLGANDGLVSNLALVMGVAGADLAGNSILVTGLAGLLAGASSMALGEWLSVQSSRELYARQIAIEKTEIESAPEEEAEELALIYQTRGLGEDEARRMARRIMDDKAGALQTLVREELGIDPEELGGSAWVAAGTSFCLFAAGAVLPVLPFALAGGRTAVGSSIGLSTLGLLVIGGATALFTGRSMAFSGARMVLFGLAAAGITFLIGRLIGVSLLG
jgi:VIT1/CCC1 family predicted Fe2+/Mn2+ transporter